MSISGTPGKLAWNTKKVSVAVIMVPAGYMADGRTLLVRVAFTEKTEIAIFWGIQPLKTVGRILTLFIQTIKNGAEGELIFTFGDGERTEIVKSDLILDQRLQVMSVFSGPEVLSYSLEEVTSADLFLLGLEIEQAEI